MNKFSEQSHVIFFGGWYLNRLKLFPFVVKEIPLWSQEDYMFHRAENVCPELIEIKGKLFIPRYDSCLAFPFFTSWIKFVNDKNYMNLLHSWGS